MTKIKIATSNDTSIVEALHLTKREFDCMVVVMYGYSYKQAGKLLTISERTVETVLRNIRIKLPFDTKNQIAHAIGKLHNEHYLSECAEHFTKIISHNPHSQDL